jgi:hypothetical protein
MKLAEHHVRELTAWRTAIRTPRVSRGIPAALSFAIAHAREINFNASSTASLDSMGAGAGEGGDV